MAPKAVGWAQDKDPFNVHMIQDINTGIPPLRMKKQASGSVKSQRKGRRPLADISTTPNRSVSTNRPFQSSKKAVSNAKEVERKPLSDISNRGTASGSATSPGKLEVIIEEEGFLHNHKECTKTRDLITDKAFFLKTLCLEDDGLSVQLVSPKRQKQEMKTASVAMEHSFLPTWHQMDGGHDSPSFPSSPSLSPSGPWDEGMLPSFTVTLSPPTLLSEDDD